MDFLKRLLRIYRVLNSCEKYRLDEEKKKREKDREKRRKNREEILLWDREDEKPESENSDEKEEEQEKEMWVVRVYRSLLKDFGRLAAICLILFFTGMVRGGLKSSAGDLVDTFKVLHLTLAALIVIQSFSTVLYRLYKEENLVQMMSMPFTPIEVAGAKLLQGLKTPYKIMLIGIVPFYLGCMMITGFREEIFLSALLAVLCIPVFVLMVLFSFVIVLFSYTRILVPRNRLVSISAPAIVVVVTGVILVVLEILFHGSVLTKILDVLADILVFNLALESIARGHLFFPLLFIVIGMGLTWRLFQFLVTRFYPRSLLLSANLDENKQEEPVDLERVEIVHSFWHSMILREFRTVKGLRVFWISNMITGLFVPLIILSCDFLLTNLIPTLAFHREMPPTQVFAVLVGHVAPLTILPGLLNKAAGTAFSRDANYMETLFVMNLDTEKLFWSKLMATVMMCSLISTPYLLVGGIILLSSGQVPIWAILPGLLLHLVLLVWVAEVKLMRDIRYRKSEWKKANELLDYRANIPVGNALIAGVVIPMLIGPILKISAFLILLLVVIMVFSASFDLFFYGLESLYLLEEQEEQDGKKKGISRFLPN